MAPPDSKVPPLVAGQLFQSGQLPQGVLLDEDGLGQTDFGLHRGDPCHLWRLIIAHAIVDAQKPLLVLPCGHVPIGMPAA